MALVIDLGCGTGRFSKLMAAHSVSKWIGVSRDAGYRRRLGEPLKIRLRADSFLARLSDDDCQQGMAALRTPGNAINQDDAVIEEIDWFVFTLQDEQARSSPDVQLRIAGFRDGDAAEAVELALASSISFSDYRNAPQAACTLA